MCGSKYVINLQYVCFMKKIVRMISGSVFRHHTDPLFIDLALIKFFDFDVCLIIKSLSHYHVGDVHDHFVGYFSRISDIHYCGTRANDELYAKHVKSVLGKTTI